MGYSDTSVCAVTHFMNVLYLDVTISSVVTSVGATLGPTVPGDSFHFTTLAFVRQKERKNYVHLLNVKYSGSFRQKSELHRKYNFYGSKLSRC
jgi:hypothetical protein